MLIPLHRPEYTSSPEIFISALAADRLRWRCADLRDVGLIFIGEPSQTKTNKVLQTLPGDLRALALACADAGLNFDPANEREVMEGLLSSLRGLEVPNGKSRPASPMTPALALMQNTRGAFRKAGPANYAAILEEMFDLGAKELGSSVSELWWQAANQRIEIDPLLKMVDTSFARKLGDYEMHEDSERRRRRPGGLSNTPFGWFHDAWVTLTRPEWVEALPPRVWVDWACSVLRLGVAMGFLWESDFYWELARHVMNGHPDPLKAVQPESGMRMELVPWADRNLPVSTRNVRGLIKRKTANGFRLRALFSQISEGETGDPRVWLAKPGLKRQLENVLARPGREKGMDNLYWTVIYNLGRREESDFYALLDGRGPAISIVSPGTEWIAMIASLAARTPGHETNVAVVSTELARLGLRPRISELIALLEEAGLARGSADADQGVRVVSAY